MERPSRKSVMLIASFVLVAALIWLHYGLQFALDVAVIICGFILLPRLFRILLSYLHIGLARSGLQPKRASTAYIRTLFDDYAGRYDRSLFDDLAYTGPSQLYQLADDHGLISEHAMVVGDLGCGTGACGPLFRSMASELVGVDLSPKMLQKAAERDVYDRLHQSDLLTFLQRNETNFDLLVAADVFVYLGDLEPVFEAARQALRGDGWIAFSVEHQTTGSYRLFKEGRYKHSTDYLRSLAASTGFVVKSQQNGAIRMEGDLPVEASFWLLERRGEQLLPGA